MHRTFVYLIIALLRLSAASSQLLQQVPLRNSGSLKIKQIATSQEVGVGFELSLGYATAAVSFPNGTTLPVHRLNGSVEYVSAMTAFANNSADCPLPGHDGLAFDQMDGSTIRPLRLNRRENHLAALTWMVQALSSEVETFLGYTIQYATAAIPFLPHLNRTHLDEVFKNVGLAYLYEGNNSAPRDSLYTPSAALVGNGLGICMDYQLNKTACQDEETSMPLFATTHIHFTKDWMLTSCPSLTSAYDFDDKFGWDAPVCMDLRAGSSHKKDEDIYYWNLVYNMIYVSGLKACNGARGDSWRFFLVTGESGDDKQLAELLRMMWRDFQQDEPPPVLKNDTLYGPAKGAAELAKRALWNLKHA